jgi:hypothetical protein
VIAALVALVVILAFYFFFFARWLCANRKTAALRIQCPLQQKED